MDKPDCHEPLFYFDRVTARVFPLRADAHALQRLCDVYLNRCPEKICFRPSAPYVMLTLLNYGSMSNALANEAHFGWVSQNELYFGVPLELGRIERGGYWRPNGESGVVAPFIFVDQAWSIEMGRQVYGWPKLPARFERGVNTWASSSPADRENLLTLATETFRTPYAGERPSRVPLVQIDRAAPPSIGPALWQAPLTLQNPWWGALTLWREAMRMWLSVASGGGSMYLSPISQLSSLLFGGSSSWFYTANLKQVRSLEDPCVASYQAITRAPMRLNALHRAGLLGEARMALGDPTGGYRIYIHRHPLFPITETLGLLVSSEDHRSDVRVVASRGYTTGAAYNTRLEPFPDGLTSSDDLKHGVVTLAPVFPFWLEADLEYGRGYTNVWRSRHVSEGVWHRRAAPGSGAANTWVASASPPYIHRDTSSDASFEATWVARAIPAPPYYYPQLTVRFLALPAAPDLQKIIIEWPEKLMGRVDLYGKFVVMMVSTSEEMDAQINSVGSWWKRQVSFLVPVKWNYKNEEIIALVSVFTFVDGDLAATTASELGPEAIAAALHAPPDSWLDYAGPRADRRLLWVATNVLPAINVGAEVKQRVLLEVLHKTGDPGDWVGEHTLGGPRWETLKEMQPCIIGRRRIPDAENPDVYAYEEWFSQNWSLRPLGQDGNQFPPFLDVRIHQYPDRVDLVGRLALSVHSRFEHSKSSQPGRAWEGAMVNIIPSMGYAWSTFDGTHVSNTSLAVRLQGGSWRPPKPLADNPVDPHSNGMFKAMLRMFRRQSKAHD